MMKSRKLWVVLAKIWQKNKKSKYRERTASGKCRRFMGKYQIIIKATAEKVYNKSKETTVDEKGQVKSQKLQTTERSL